jgi:hypothetical protein
MTPHFLKTAVVASALVMSVAANAATPLGSIDRRDDSEVTSRKTFNVTIKHTKPVGFKLKTAGIPAHFMANAKKNNVQAKKGGAK